MNMSAYMGLVHNFVLNKMENGELRIDSVDDLKKVLREYEIHTKIIEEQLELCKRDHADLRSEMRRLMQENQDLYERLKSSSESLVKSNSDFEAVELVENLQHQLLLAMEEKGAMEKMWKTNVEEMDTLREALQEYTSGKKMMALQSKLDDVQKDYTEAIKILENNKNALKADNEKLNAKCRTLEDQLKQVNLQMTSVSEKNGTLNNSLKEATEQEKKWKSKFLALEANFIDLDRAYQADKVKYAQIREFEKAESTLRSKLEGSQRNANELQRVLEQCSEHKQDLLRQVAAYRTRLDEAIALAEAANRDKEKALANAQLAAEETKKLRANWDKMVDEAGRKVVSEEAVLRKQFEAKMATVENQLKVVEQERNRKRVEVEQMKKECDRLQKLVAEKQSHGVEQQQRLSLRLSTAETNCDSLKRENQALRDAMDKLEDKLRQKSQRRQKMENELQRLIKDTQFYQQELALSEKKADILNSQLQATSLDLAQLQSNTILHKCGSAQIEPRVSLTSTLELCKKLEESFGNMNKKWKTEMSTLTDKVEEKLKKSKKVKLNT